MPQVCRVHHQSQGRKPDHHEQSHGHAEEQPRDFQGQGDGVAGKETDDVNMGEHRTSHPAFCSSPSASRLYCCNLLRSVLRLMPSRVAALVWMLLHDCMTCTINSRSTRLTIFSCSSVSSAAAVCSPCCTTSNTSVSRSTPRMRPAR